MIGFVAALALVAQGAELEDRTPKRDRHPVLVVTTPGFAADAYDPLVDGLKRRGRDVHVLTFGCQAPGVDALVDELKAARATLPEDVVVVSHGIGATVALMAEPELGADRHVALAPVLGIVPVELTAWLAEQRVDTVTTLQGDLSWRGHSVTAALLGPAPPARGCVSAAVLRDVQGWIQAGRVPLDPELVRSEVWVGLSLGDDVATLEGAVPVARALPTHELERLGLNRFDGQDFSHGEMLTHRVPVRAAAKATVRRRLRRRPMAAVAP